MAASVADFAVLACLFLLCASSQASDGGQQHLVLVHGLGHGAWCWYKVSTILRNRGFEVTPIDLQSAAINKDALADDVTSVAQFTKPLTDFLQSVDHKVILVGHSLGGGSLAYASQLFPGKISKAVYLAASLPLDGDTFFSAFDPRTFPRLLNAGDVVSFFANGADRPATSVALNPAKVREFFYNESPELDINLALTLLTKTPFGIGNDALHLTNDKYGSVDKFYIKTLADFGVLTEEQEYMIARNPPLCVFPLPKADHAPFFSTPQQLVSILARIAAISPSQYANNCGLA